MESLNNGRNRYLNFENYVYNDNTLDQYVSFSIDKETDEFSFYIEKGKVHGGQSYEGSVEFSPNALTLHYKSVGIWFKQSTKQPLDYTVTFNYTMEPFKYQRTSTNYYTGEEKQEEADAYKITFDKPFTVNSINTSSTDTCVYYYPTESAPRIKAPIVQIDSELIEQ
jgi:hypothetical protein